MIPVRAYAARSAGAHLTPFQFERREPGPRDVQLDILYCGVCHGDLHFSRNDHGFSRFPMVPGHEIVGRVVRVGPEVKRVQTGDLVGVGCLVDSCRTCDSCREGQEQYCDAGGTQTYNSLEKDGTTHTLGGYSEAIVVDEDFVLKVPANLDPAAVAPLLCAGITTYSPLRHWKVGPGQRVGVVGLGGLGHVGVKLARAMGAHVTVFSQSERKRQDALRLGAEEFVVSSSPEEMAARAGRLDFILDTVSAAHDVNPYLALLKRDGHLAIVGVPERPLDVAILPMIARRRSLSGSNIGGIAETQAMLDFCGEHGIVSDIELIPIQGINEAFTRLEKGDVKYRFVIDLKSLG
ncbi:NAD(P)-dependent alcohol dehydrogenase [Corallococcus sp. AB004]|uniref:NAD(P)-dependent alcohol dehydrogenase n=1 Tax=Corallococcus TaxID=83461 RepID=UPI000EA29532|nr:MULTISPECIES: NAD(P)-dependent alcohol dehydrogenase [Corallococcus]NPC70457.1 NAD(P)-dependent alcohol dehydrogenase [Corallococcus exiguus]NPD22610.1 NAD(P)-dependent alcohol dehydrogenase [Corallococcus exiguus]RKI04072.1 NAD(P)-dependent alcohol dehydrogenase [Corallococcus sp. AB038B]RKI38610.1 NAD(P)-dependent alcohol dehydrogenase [Corallococcus sp. AB004]